MIEYISKEDISRVLSERILANKICLRRARELELPDSIQYFNNLLFEDGQITSIIEELPSASLPDSAGVENYTVEKLNQILEWGYCFCDTDDNEFCKAIKNAIEIITALQRLKAEIRDNANHCECVPDGSCIRVDKVLEIIDKYIGGKDK